MLDFRSSEVLFENIWHILETILAQYQKMKNFLQNLVFELQHAQCFEYARHHACHTTYLTFGVSSNQTKWRAQEWILFIHKELTWNPIISEIELKN